MMKKDNEQMQEHIDYVRKGGDIKDLDEKQVETMFGNSPEKFKTPHIDNIFDMDSDF